MESSQPAPTEPRRLPEVIHKVLIGCSPLQDVITVSRHSVRKGKPEVSLGHEGSPAVFDDEGVLVSELCPQDFNFRPGLVTVVQGILWRFSRAKADRAGAHE
jgi:hypothetical protein